MKVLIAFPGLLTKYRTGVISIVKYLPDALKKRNCEVKIILFSDDKKAVEKDYICVYTKKLNLISLYKFASEVKKEAYEGKYDIVHGQTGTSVLYKALGSKVPACITNHGVGFKVYHFYWKYQVTKNWNDFLPYIKYFPRRILDPFSAHLLFRLADRITTVSNFTKNEISKIYGIPEVKMDVVPNGVPLEIFTPDIPIKQKEEIKKKYNFERALLFLPPVPRKGLHLIIEALPTIIREYPELKLLVAGSIPTNDTYFKFCYKLSQKLNVAKKIIFVGRVSDSDLPKYYATATAYVLPTLYEALPLTVLESMACGTPVCASNWGGLREIIKDGEDGLLFDYANVTSIANKIITLLCDDSLQKKLRYNARKKIEKQYSWDHVADLYIQVYEKTIQNQ